MADTEVVGEGVLKVRDDAGAVVDRHSSPQLGVDGSGGRIGDRRPREVRAGRGHGGRAAVDGEWTGHRSSFGLTDAPVRAAV
jgi:hypothetical protein